MKLSYIFATFSALLLLGNMDYSYAATKKPPVKNNTNKKPAAAAKGKSKQTSKAPAKKTSEIPAPKKAPPPFGKHTLNIEFIFRPGKQRTIGEVDVQYPLYQNIDKLLFADLRGMMDNKKDKEVNVGLAYRQVIYDTAVLGFYGFGDARRTRNHNNFLQATFGMDVLSRDVDGRLNVYVPQRKKRRIKGPGIAKFSGYNLQTYGSYEVAMNGFDGELGLRIPVGQVDAIEPRIFLGGYQFYRSGLAKISGPRVRFELKWHDILSNNSRMTLGAEFSRDNVRGKNTFISLALKFPLQPPAEKDTPKGLYRRLEDYVIRDVDINTQSTPILDNPKAIVPGTQTPFFIVTVDANAPSDGDGTAEKPFNTLDSVLTNTGLDIPGRIIFIKQTGTQTLNWNTPVSVTKDNQRIISHAIDWFFTDGTYNKSYLIKKETTTQPTVVNSSVNNPLTLANSVQAFEVAGLNYTLQNGSNNHNFYTATVSDNASLSIHDMTFNNAVTTHGNTIILSVQQNGKLAFNLSNIAYEGGGGSDQNIAGSNADFVRLNNAGTTTFSTSNVTFAPGTSQRTVFRLFNGSNAVNPGLPGYLTIMEYNSNYRDGARVFDIAELNLSGTTASQLTLNASNSTVTNFNPTVGEGGVLSYSMSPGGGATKFSSFNDTKINFTRFNITSGTAADFSINSSLGNPANLGNTLAATTGNTSITMNLDRNTHNHTSQSVNTRALRVLLPASGTAAGNAHQINMTNCTMTATGTTPDSAIEFYNIANAVNHAGSAKLMLANTTISNTYNYGIKVSDGTTTPGTVNINLANGGNNSISGLSNSIYRGATAGNRNNVFIDNVTSASIGTQTQGQLKTPVN